MKKATQYFTISGMALLAMLANQSCTKTVRGCMDKKATNFNPVADASCSSCCIYALDTVSPNNGNVLFYSTEMAPGVTLSNGKVITAATGTGCTDPASTNHISLQPGTYTYTASNSAGMGWSGVFTVATGQCNTITLSASNAASGKIAFSTDNTGLGAITVTLDNNTAGSIVPYLYSPSFAGPGFDVVAAPGVHSYTASSANGQTWSGTVNVTSGNTAGVTFERANMTPVASGYCNVIFFTTVEPDYTVHFNNANIGNGITYSANGTGLASQKWIVSAVVPSGTYTWWATTLAGKYFSGTVLANGKSIVAVQIN